MPVQRDLFVDCHCHLFNIEDIPIYATISSLTTIRGQRTGIRSLALLGAIFGRIEKELEKQKPFIKFFETPISENAKAFIRQLDDAFGPIPKVVTPLIMDFEEIKGSDKQAEEQLANLKGSVGDVAGNCMILPFLGYDLRKLESDTGLQDFIDLWNACRGYDDDGRRRNLDQLRNGNIIGIKLYPSTGFHPYPLDDEDIKKADRQTKWKRYRAFYNWCVDEQIPITVHCQKDSYLGNGVEPSQAKVYTNPENWRKVLKTDGLRNLCINFAHFGGETDLEVAVFRQKKLGVQPGTGFNNEEWELRDRFRRDKWSCTIMTLLKKYTNTYADISAFDFTRKKAAKALASVLSLDEEGKLDEHLRIDSSECRLRDKLLWGSDVPMPISHRVYRKDNEDDGESHYKYLYQTFRDSLKEAGLDVATLDEIDAALTCTNPKRFLFGG
jgi:hypothetical protein